MRTLRAIQIAGAVAALAFAFAPPVWAQDAGVAKDEAAAQASPSLTGSFKPPTARVRYIHAIAGAWRTDLRFETRPVWTNIVNTGGTPFKAVPLGTYQAAVTSPLGNTTMIGPEPITIGLGIDYTVLAVGALSGEPPFEMVVATWPAIPVPSYATCFAAIHASPDAPPIDILVDATPIATGLAYKGFTGLANFPRGKHLITVKSGATTLFGPTLANFQPSTKYTFVLMGNTDPEDGIPLMLKVYTSP